MLSGISKFLDFLHLQKEPKRNVKLESWKAAINGARMVLNKKAEKEYHVTLTKSFENKPSVNEIKTVWIKAMNVLKDEPSMDQMSFREVRALIFFTLHYD